MFFDEMVPEKVSTRERCLLISGVLKGSCIHQLVNVNQ